MVSLVAEKPQFYYFSPIPENLMDYEDKISQALCFSRLENELLFLGSSDDKAVAKLNI